MRNTPLLCVISVFFLFNVFEAAGQAGEFEITDKGMLIPRMGTEEISQISPLDGLMVYDSTLDRFFYYSDMSNTWLKIEVGNVARFPVLSALTGTLNGTIPNQPSRGSYWDIGGNSGANLYSDPPLLGNVDSVPIVFITNDIERLRILEGGDITIARSLEVGENLVVKQNVELNTDGGETINYGPLTVERTSPTYLTGIMTVDSVSRLKSDVYLNEDGGETVNYGPLTVDRTSPTYLTGTMTVDSVTRLKSDVYLNEDGGETINYGPLTVDRTSPTYLTGTMTVDSVTRLKSDVYMNEDGGETVNYGPLTVDRTSPTYLTGIMTVDSVTRLKSDVNLNEDGGQSVNYGPLTVDRTSPTYLTGTMTVDSVTRLKSDVYLNEDGGETINYGALTVERTNPTYLTGTLTVDSLTRLKSDVYLNESGGATMNNGPFTVANQNMSSLTGSLTVDQLTSLNEKLKIEASTTLYGPLLVDDMQPSFFPGRVNNSNLTRSDSAATSSGALVVRGGVGIAENLNIGGNFAINGIATFGGKVAFTKPVTISAPDESNDTSSGALRIVGGVGIGKNLYVGRAMAIDSTLYVEGATDLMSTMDVTRSTLLGGNLGVTGATKIMNNLHVKNNTTMSGTLNVAGITSIKDITQSTNTTSGALQVSGGVGVQKNIRVGGATTVTNASTFKSSLDVTSTSTFKSSLDVTGASTLGSSLDVTGASTLKSSLDVTGASTLKSSLNVTGSSTFKSSLEVIGATSISGPLTVQGETTISNILIAETCTDPYFAEFINTSNRNGIKIKIANSTPSFSNNYMTFQSSSDGTLGRIAGRLEYELIYDEEYTRVNRQIEWAVTAASIQVATASTDLAVAITYAAAAWLSVTPCASTACIPIPSLIAAYSAGVVGRVANLTAVSVGLAEAQRIRDDFNNSPDAKAGVSYNSRGADYAEWLPKADTEGTYLQGNVVGIKNGKISLVTKGADKILAVSSNPIILGNMPPEEKEDDFEKVAFMGQVPVLVTGRVQMGDYIVPSGLNDGYARAVSPTKMTAEDYAHLVGMAWSASSGDAINRINVAIGLNDGDISKLLLKHNNTINKFDSQLDEVRHQRTQEQMVLARLVPGFRKAKDINEDNLDVPQYDKERHPEKKRSSQIVDIIPHDPSTIIYFEITREQIMDGIDLAESMFLDSGGDINNHPFWSKIKTDLAYKDRVANSIKDRMQKALNAQKMLNAKSIYKN